MPIRIEGHLTEQSLKNALLEIVGENNWIGTQLQFDEDGIRRFRWDMGFTLGDRAIYVEFDGHFHYQNPENIGRDEFKDRILCNRGITTVRIPYWVQLTSETLLYYFQLDQQIIQDFPHGFITTTKFPSSFCEMGLNRFNTELASLPEGVRADVLESLHNQAIAHRYGERYVIPESIT